MLDISGESFAINQLDEQWLLNCCWLMISWGIVLPNLLGIIIFQERGIPSDV